MKNFALSGLLFGAALAGAAPAFAQTASDEKTIGDWRVHCGGPAQTPCEMLQLVGNKTTGQQIMAISVIYIPANDIHLMQLILPLGAALPKGVVIKSDNFTSPKIVYNRCEQMGCVVALPLNKEAILNLSQKGPNTAVVFSLDGGKDINVRISFNGFTEADNYLVEQVKAKVKNTPPPAAPGVINGAQ